jgi:GT2 family glycosyltransferase
MLDTQSKILIVLVLYQTDQSCSRISLISLIESIEKAGLAERFRLLIYDNSPFKSPLPDSLPMPFYFVHDPSNGGILQACQKALELSDEEGYEWLLLLDQDTTINEDYIQTVCHSLSIAFDDPRCAALVPKLISNNKVVSPARVLRGGRLKPVGQNFSGTPTWEITAFNSGAIIRASAIRAIGGLSPVFWLDYLDHWIFNQIYRAGFSLQVLDATLGHELSVDCLGTMNVDRYKNVLFAEGEFYRCCKSLDENLIYLVRLICRALMMVMVPARIRLFTPTSKHLKRTIWRLIS